MTTSYDPKCEELARYFLAGDGSGGGAAKENDVKELARVIQTAIEDWNWGREPAAQEVDEGEDESGQGAAI